MAIKPRDNEAFYREVDEELRREQLSQGWQRWGKFIIGGFLLLLAAIAGFLYWQQHQEEQRGVQGERYTKVLDETQAKGAATVPELEAIAAEGEPGYRASALLAKADIAAQTGDLPGAAAAFKAIADDAKLPQPYRDLALVRQTAAEFDRIPPQQIIDRLRPLAMAGNPWFGSAGEMTALAYLKLNQPKRAAPIFAAMAREEALPPSIRSRAVQMAGALGVDATPPVGARPRVVP